jgi:hypothetical protein
MPTAAKAIVIAARMRRALTTLSRAECQAGAALLSADEPGVTMEPGHYPGESGR